MSNVIPSDATHEEFCRDAALGAAVREWLDWDHVKRSCWPEEIWPMTDEQYVKAVPDDALRTAISGYLMRNGWKLAVQELCALVEERLTAEDTPEQALAAAREMEAGK